ncbi:MAG TPA: UbiA-like polyprenyltransferase [Bryobacteraceae bacterium]|nr:UbiA-like polyprenyltransferase [Bryobacteraceae bacterium]
MGHGHFGVTMREGFLKKVRLTLEMIKFEHSVFALPFALTGGLLAVRESGFRTEGLAWKFGWILVAMVGARSAAMAFNRLLDADLDARNPRTRTRHLPAGLLSRGFAWGFTAVSSLVFLLAARALNDLCFRLAPVALGLVFFYSFTKRFTTMSHLVLGLSLGVAPAAAWIAIQGSLDPRVLWLTLAVTLWTAGFDVIYSCPDRDFDAQEGLFSLPRRFGIAGALWISRLFHAGMVVALAMLVRSFGLGALSIVGVSLVALLLIWEQSLVKPHDLSRVNAAFFTMNGYVSVLFFLFWAADILILRSGA